MLRVAYYMHRKAHMSKIKSQTCVRQTIRCETGVWGKAMSGGRSRAALWTNMAHCAVRTRYLIRGRLLRLLRLAPFCGAFQWHLGRPCGQKSLILLRARSILLEAACCIVLRPVRFCYISGGLVDPYGSYCCALGVSSGMPLKPPPLNPSFQLQCEKIRFEAGV